MSPQTSPVIDTLEQELAVLVRALEAIGRHRDYPLERAHYLLLIQLADGALSTSELAARLALDHSTVTRQIAAMQKRGLVVKRTNPEDRRSSLIDCTETGIAQAAAMRTVRLERVDALFADWDKADCETLATLLTRFNRTLSHTLASLQHTATVSTET